MATITRCSIPITNSCCRFVIKASTASFHTRASHAAKVAPRRSPTVQRKARIFDPGASHVQVKNSRDPEAALPPQVLLDTALKSGLLTLETGLALHVLRKYQETEVKGVPGWEKKLCENLGVTSGDLVLLARILNRCSEDAQKSLGRRVMFSASVLGEVPATLELINSAIRTKAVATKPYAPALQRLGVLAKEGEPRAMALLGKVLLSQHKLPQALEWFQKATKEEGGEDFAGKGDALVSAGKILLKIGKEEEASTAFMRAMAECDDAEANYEMSKLSRPLNPDGRLFLLKAAASGVMAAAHELGILELAELEDEKRKTGLKGAADFGMAKDWFQVAAAGGYGPSMLGMAMICHAEGKKTSGLAWLDIADGMEGMRGEVKIIKDMWDKEHLTLGRLQSLTREEA